MKRLVRGLASDGMIFFMIGVVVVETVAFLWWRQTTGRGPSPAFLISFMGAGGSLMVAMYLVRRIERTALPFATALLSALFFHAWHMYQLWNR
jgi:hypothetical protein